MRRYIPALLLLLAAVAPFPLAGCDMINKLKGGADARLDRAALTTAPVDADVVATGGMAADGIAGLDAAPLPTGATTLAVTPTPRPTVKADAAAPVADAGLAKVDSGVAPAPTPTLKFPTNLFDAGGIKFDAGGFKPPWVK